MKTLIFNAYQLNEHPRPDKVLNWIRHKWDLGDHVLEEMVASLKAFSKHIGVEVDWALSIVPYRGEFVRFLDEPSGTPQTAFSEKELAGECPFTGVVYDEVILDAFRECDPDDTWRDVFKDIEYRVLKAIHAEGDWLYSDDGLSEMCDANEYYFYENGEIA